jgi:drug/metabolite transporter (DMT)-like permease
VALGLLWLRDRLSAGEWAGAAIALVGVIVISFQPGDFLRLGSLFVLASSFLYALHTAVVKRYGEDMDFSSFFLGRIGATTFFLFFFAVSSPDLVWPTWKAWLVLALAGLIGIVISRALYYLALRKLQLSNHALILTLSPVVAIIWSILFFDEAPTLQSYQGGALVIVGVMVLAWYQRQRRLQRAL